jgi:HCOMODA/2-hydroxy-3-carboxy-muconic semialdehyde decarboxylase
MPSQHSEQSPERQPGGDLARAGKALVRQGLATAFGHVSVRVGDTFVISPPTPLDAFGADQVLTVPLGIDELPAGVPKEAWIHHEIYRRRDDVGAVCRSQPPVATALVSAGVPIRPLHGQGAFLGPEVAVHPDSHLVRNQSAGTALADRLGDAPGIVMRGNGAVTVGSDLASATALMWVLEASARMNTTASAAGAPQALPASEQDYWRSVAPELLARIWLWISREERI